MQADADRLVGVVPQMKAYGINWRDLVTVDKSGMFALWRIGKTLVVTSVVRSMISIIVH